MCPRRLRPALALPALVAALGGCGQGSSSHPLSLDQLPLTAGASVVARAQQCDRGANAFCAIEAVIVDPHYESSGALVAGEHRRLRELGWSAMAGDNGTESASDSPGNKLRVTYATAANDLAGIDLGWIKRPRSIELTLAGVMFNRAPAMSVMLEDGSG